MGRLFLMSLAATGRIYCCKHCNAHLAYATDIVSKSFRCKHGKAYLFHKCQRECWESDDRMMTTGLHTVCDIFCVGCGSILGWKYLAAFDKDQRYKEGNSSWRGRCKVSAPTGAIQQLWAEHDARAGSSDDDDQDAV